MLTRNNNNRSKDHCLYNSNIVYNCVVSLLLYQFPACRPSRTKTRMNNFLFPKSENTAHVSTILLYVYAENRCQRTDLSLRVFIAPYLKGWNYAIKLRKYYSQILNFTLSLAFLYIFMHIAGIVCVFLYFLIGENRCWTAINRYKLQHLCMSDNMYKRDLAPPHPLSLRPSI